MDVPELCQALKDLSQAHKDYIRIFRTQFILGFSGLW